MKYLFYIFAFTLSISFCYMFKPVEAQAQKSMSSRGSIGSTTSMSMLKNIAPTRDGALISIDSAYFVNNQWYKAIFQYSRNETRPANASRIYVTVMGRTGAWNVYKFGISWQDIFDLPGILTGILNRAKTDSTALISETAARIAADNQKLNITDAANQYQPKGTYVAAESDPVYNANGATKIALAAEVTRATGVEATKENVLTFGYGLLRSVNSVLSDTASIQGLASKARVSAALALYQRVLTAGTGISIIGGVVANTLPDRTVTLTNGGGIGIIGTYPDFTIAQSTPTYNNAPARALTTSFRPSTTRPTRVSYTVSIATTLSLLNLNSSGTVALQISADNTTWTTINSAGVTRTLAVSISVGLNDTSLLNIQGEIPAGYYCRLLPTTSGGSTVTFMSGQEVTY